MSRRVWVVLATLAGAVACGGGGGNDDGTGGSAGREGPIVHIGSAIGSVAGQFLGVSARRLRTFVASGAGIRVGIRVDRVRNLDVAPTIAKLLGLDLPTATGDVIEEILESGSVTDVATAYLRAIQDQDWERMGTFLTDESIYQDFTMEYFNRDAIDLVGRDVIVGFWRDSSADSGTSEIRYVVEDRLVAGPAILLELALHVRVSGAYFNVDRAELAIDSRVFTFLRIENGRITHHFDFADYADAMRKIDAER